MAVNFSVLTDTLTDIADAVRAKTGTTDPIALTTLAGAIAAIETEPNVISKSITANGTYNADDDSVDGYSSVTVAIPRITSLVMGGPVLKPSDFEYGAGNTIVTDTHTHTGGVPGPSIPSDPHGCIFDRETVTSCQIVFQTAAKTIAQNGTYDLLQESPESLITKVTVEVPQSDTSDATALASDLVSGKTAYVNKTKITGTMAIYAGEVI